MVMSVRTALVWNYGSHLLIFAVTMAGLIAMARLLTPVELGIFGVGMAISGLMAAFSHFGVANYLIRHHDLTADVIATGFTVNSSLSIGVSALLWLLGTVGQPLFSTPQIADVLRWLSIVPLFAIFEFLPSTMLTRNMGFGRLSATQLGKVVVNVGVMVAAAFSGWSYLSPAFGAIASAVFGAIAFSLAGRSYVSLRLSLRNARSVLIFTLQMISAGGIPILATRASELIVAQFLGLGALGVYTRATGLANMVWDGAYGLSTRVIYVKMARELREYGSFKETYLHSVKLLTAVMWPTMAGIAVLAGPIIYWLYGSQWQGAAAPLALLMLGQIVAMSFAMNWELCILANRTGWQARVEALRAGIGLAAFTVGSLFSLPLATSGKILEAVLGYVIYRPKMVEMAQTTQIEISQAYRQSPLLAAVAVAPAFWLLLVSMWAPSVPLGSLIGAIAAGVVLWAAALVTLKHPLADEAGRLCSLILGTRDEVRR